MANPQPDKFTKISNELLEVVIRTYMSNYEHRIFWLIVRKTYGYNKKSDWISQSQIVEETRILKQHVSRTIKKLKEKNMIMVIDKKLAIQKDYDLWELPKQVTNKSNLNGLQEVTQMGTEVTQMGVKSNPNGGTPQKTIIQKKEIHTVFDFWNSKKIIIHRKIDQATTSRIINLLKDYSLKEIQQAIHNYSVILFDDDYFFKYSWTLKDFLQRGFEKFKNKKVAHNNYIKEEK